MLKRTVFTLTLLVFGLTVLSRATSPKYPDILSYHPPAYWSLLVIPARSRETNWSEIIASSPALRVTYAVSTQDYPRLAPIKDRLQKLETQRKIDFALRLPQDPPLALIFDQELCRNFLPKGIILPSHSIAWSDDALAQIAQAKLAYRTFWEEEPKGFVPAGGSLSLPVAEFLKKQRFFWTIGSFPEQEWKEGQCLSWSEPNEQPFRIYSAHPLSIELHQKDFMEPRPANVQAAARDLAANLFERIHSQGSTGVAPLVVFDEERAQVPLKDFLGACEKEAAHYPFLKMIFSAEVADFQNADVISNDLQIWPYSWPWVTGAGNPRGPGLTAWIGDSRKNAAWDQLANAHDEIERYKNSGQADLRKLDRALAEFHLAQSTDFFEWFGNLIDEMQSARRSELSREQKERQNLFKASLANVYRHLGSPLPDSLKGIPAVRSRHVTPVPVAGQEEPEMAAAPQNYGLTLSRANGWTRWTAIPPPLYMTQFAVKAATENAKEDAVDFQFSIKPQAAVLNCVELYIDINRREGAGISQLLFGRGAAVSSTDAWEYVLVCRKTGSAQWSCRLMRGNQTKPIYEIQVKTFTRDDRPEEVSWTVPVPRSLLGRDPLRWGYLSCIMENEGKPIVDFLSPVRDKTRILEEFKSRAERPESGGIEMVLPMMRAESFY